VKAEKEKERKGGREREREREMGDLEGILEGQASLLLDVRNYVPVHRGEPVTT